MNPDRVYPHQIAPARESDHRFQPQPHPTDENRFNTFIEKEYESHVQDKTPSYSDAYKQGYIDACKQRDDASLFPQSTNQHFFNAPFSAEAQYAYQQAPTEQHREMFDYSVQYDDYPNMSRNEHSFTDQSYQIQQRSMQRHEYIHNTDYMKSIDMLLSSTGRFPMDAQQQQQQQDYRAYQMENVNMQHQTEHHDTQETGFGDYSDTTAQTQVLNTEQYMQEQAQQPEAVAPAKKAKKVTKPRPKRLLEPVEEKQMITSVPFVAQEMQGISSQQTPLHPFIIDNHILQAAVRPLKPEMRGHSLRNSSEESGFNQDQVIIRRRSAGRPKRFAEEDPENTFRTSSTLLDDQAIGRGLPIARVSGASNGNTSNPPNVTGASKSSKAKPKTKPVYYQPYPMLPIPPAFGPTSMQYSSTSMNSSNAASSHSSPSSTSLPPAQLYNIAYSTQPVDPQSEVQAQQNSTTSAPTSSESTPMNPQRTRDMSRFKQRGQRQADEANKFRAIPPTRPILPYITSHAQSQAFMAQNFQSREGKRQSSMHSNETGSGSIMSVYSNTQLIAPMPLGLQTSMSQGGSPDQPLPMNQRSFFREPRVYLNPDYVAPELDEDDQGENRAPGEVEEDTRPNVCATCDKSFKRSFNLITHAKTHLNLRPYVCGVCKRRFGRQFDLTRHVLTHTDEKEFMCITCNRSVDALKRHERKDEFGVMLYCRGIKLVVAQPEVAKGAPGI